MAGRRSTIPRKNVRGESVLQNVKIWSRATGSGDAADAGAGEDGLDLGAEDQGSVGLRVEERADAQPVARQEQGPLPCVPDGDGELAVEARQAPAPTPRTRAGPTRCRTWCGTDGPGLQFQPQLRMVEDLPLNTIQRDPSSLAMGCWPVRRSMMLSRAFPRPT